MTLKDARLSFGARTLWDGLDLEVQPGEFIAVLGPNGSGKTSLLKILLGQLQLSGGSAQIVGTPRHGPGTHTSGTSRSRNRSDDGLPLRGRDLGRPRRRRSPVGYGPTASGVVAARSSTTPSHRSAPSRSPTLPSVPLSGGEQQRLRIAQALVGDPRILLCDEPLLSLDLANQHLVSTLIDKRRRSHDTAVLFVTHEINPILPLVDRVLYLVDGKFRIGTPAEVMTSEVLSDLYNTDVEVLQVRGPPRRDRHRRRHRRARAAQAGLRPGEGVHHSDEDHHQ